MTDNNNPNSSSINLHKLENKSSAEKKANARSVADTAGKKERSTTREQLKRQNMQKLKLEKHKPCSSGINLRKISPTKMPLCLNLSKPRIISRQYFHRKLSPSHITAFQLFFNFRIQTTLITLLL